MTAVLEVRPSSAGRHRAPEDSTTGSMGVLPTDLRERSAHGGPAGRRGPARPHTAETPALQRAARTAGLSLAALGALATAGGLATDNLVGGPSDDAPATGEVALSPQLASADLALAPAQTASSDAATASVLPVVSSARDREPRQARLPGLARRGPHRAQSRQTASNATSSTDQAAAAPAAASSVGARALAEARSQIGVPYVWGGTTPSGFDCSGLMQWAFDKVGKDLPRTSAAQSRVGQSVTRDQLQPGDLIFFNSPVSHVAMYAGNGQMVEAPNSGQDVKTSSLSRRMDDVVGYRRI